MRYDPAQFAVLGRQDSGEPMCRLWWSASGVRFLAACAVLEVEIEAKKSDQAPWIGVLADGAPIARFPLLPGKHSYPVLAGMDAAVSHEITILRDSQPTDDEIAPPVITALISDGTLRPAPARERLIEFIGDSLTVGEGTAGPVSAMEWRGAWMSHMCAFPSLVSEKLRADSRVIAIGGWGVWRSYDDQEAHTLGQAYERLCLLNPAGNHAYDFRERPADAVVINLGTNDSGPFGRAADQQAAAQDIMQKAVALTQLVRRHQPGAEILWAYGLCGNAVAPALQAAVEQIRAAGDGRVSYLALEDCNGDLGARQHPSRAAHRRAAEQIAAELEKKWRSKP